MVPTEVRNDYMDDDRFIHIDVWESNDDNEEGKTVAIVCADTKKVFFIDNLYRHIPAVKEAVEEAVKRDTSKKTIYMTVIRYEVLSNYPLNGNETLKDIAYFTEEGEMSGQFLQYEVLNQPLTGQEAVNAVVNQGSVPEFFQMDNEGNTIEV